MQNTNDPVGFNPARPKELGPGYGRGNFQSSSGSGAAAPSSVGQGSPSGRDVAERAREAASATADAVKSQASDLASQGRDKLMEKAQDQKRAGAEYLSRLADTIRRSADEFDKDVPFAANYIRSAASGVDSVAETVRNGDFSQLVTQTQDFARRQPTLFVGLSMLAGFGVARLLKGSAAPMMSGSGERSLSHASTRTPTSAPTTYAPTHAPTPSGQTRGAAGLRDMDDPPPIGSGTAGGASSRQLAGGDDGSGI